MEWDETGRGDRTERIFTQKLGILVGVPLLLLGLVVGIPWYLQTQSVILERFRLFHSIWIWLLLLVLWVVLVSKIDLEQDYV